MTGNLSFGIKMISKSSYPNIQDVSMVWWLKCQDYSLEVSKLCYYVPFGLTPLGKICAQIPTPSHGLNSTTTVLLQEWIWH